MKKPIPAYIYGLFLVAFTMAIYSVTIYFNHKTTIEYNVNELDKYTGLLSANNERLERFIDSIEINISETSANPKSSYTDLLKFYLDLQLLYFESDSLSQQMNDALIEISMLRDFGRKICISDKLEDDHISDYEEIKTITLQSFTALKENSQHIDSRIPDDTISLFDAYYSKWPITFKNLVNDYGKCENKSLPKDLSPLQSALQQSIPELIKYYQLLYNSSLRLANSSPTAALIVAKCARMSLEGQTSACYYTNCIYNGYKLLYENKHGKSVDQYMERIKRDNATQKAKLNSCIANLSLMLKNVPREDLAIAQNVLDLLNNINNIASNIDPQH